MNLQQKRRELVFCAVNIALPLLAGAYIYIRIGRDSYFGNLICELFNISKISANSEIREFFRNWGGGFWWAYALFFAVYALRRSFSEAVLISAACSVTVELLKLIEIDYIKSGTFDVWDILIELSAILIGAIILYSCRGILIKKERRKNDAGE